jgi:hypothetical protein
MNHGGKTLQRSGKAVVFLKINVSVLTSFGCGLHFINGTSLIPLPFLVSLL